MRFVNGCAVFVLCWFLSGAVHAEEFVPGPPQFLPERLDYGPYIADPRRARFGGGLLAGSGGELQFDTAIGGAFPFFNFKPGDPPFEKVQFAGSAVVLPRWDIHNDLNEVGADFRAGLSLSAMHGLWGLRLQLLHESDHLGDEFILRTGQSKRLAYLREEIDLGASYFPCRDLRLYAEGSYGFSIGESNMAWKAQGGVEWEGGPRLPLGARLYAATDLQTYQEVHWNPDWTTQVGVVEWNVPRTRSLRIFAEYHLGHDPLGEFFYQRLNFCETGLAFDF